MNFLNPFLAANLKGDCVEATRFMDSVSLSGVIFSKKILGSLACSATNFKASVFNEEMISIYPNPAKTSVSVKLTAANNSINTLKIISVTGQLLISTSIENNEADITVRELKNGLYFIKLYNDDKLVAIKKLIKE
jgi:hypothetical protein